METSTNRTTAAVTHLSALSQYFIPFGNFIFPIVIWSTSKKNSHAIDHHGRQAINFQLSLFLYSLILVLIAIPIFVTSIFKNVPVRDFINGHFDIDTLNVANLTGMVSVAVIAAVIFFFLKVAEFFLIINAAVQAANGKLYNYPLTINFVGNATVTESSTETEMPIEPQQA